MFIVVSIPIEFLCKLKLYNVYIIYIIEIKERRPSYIMLRDTVLRGEKVIIRSIQENDLPILWRLIYGKENPEWKKWDAPYIPLEKKEYETYKSETLNKLRVANQNEVEPRLIIETDGKIIGTVSYYWEHRPSNWLEVGIGIYNPIYWSGGYGTEALKLWIDYLFGELPLVRVGLATWSGNKRMIRVAEKIGMQLEGRLRKCRLYNGKYYDSIRMGILKEEWEDNYKF